VEFRRQRRCRWPILALFRSFWACQCRLQNELAGQPLTILIGPGATNRRARCGSSEAKGVDKFNKGRVGKRIMLDYRRKAGGPAHGHGR